MRSCAPVGRRIVRDGVRNEVPRLLAQGRLSRASQARKPGGAVRRLSRKGDPDALVAAMARLWDSGRLLNGSDFESMRRRLEAANAFSDDDDAILRF